MPLPLQLAEVPVGKLVLVGEIVVVGVCLKLPSQYRRVLAVASHRHARHSPLRNPHHVVVFGGAVVLEGGAHAVAAVIVVGILHVRHHAVYPRLHLSGDGGGGSCRGQTVGMHLHLNPVARLLRGEGAVLSLQPLHGLVGVDGEPGAVVAGDAPDGHLPAVHTICDLGIHQEGIVSLGVYGHRAEHLDDGAVALGGETVDQKLRLVVQPVDVELVIARGE